MHASEDLRHDREVLLLAVTAQGSGRPFANRACEVFSSEIEKLLSTPTGEALGATHGDVVAIPPRRAHDNAEQPPS